MKRIIMAPYMFALRPGVNRSFGAGLILGLDPRISGESGARASFGRRCSVKPEHDGVQAGKRESLEKLRRLSSQIDSIGPLERQRLDVMLDDGRGGDRRDVGMIIGRRDLDHIHATDIEIADRPEDAQRLIRREAARNRRAGAGREGGIERVDVEGEIGRALPDPLADAPRRAGYAEFLRLIAVDDGDAAIARRHRADADLDRALDIDQSFAHRLQHEAAMADAARAVIPGVLMGIELDQRQLAMARNMGAQQRQGDEMIAAERNEMGAGREDAGGFRLDRTGATLEIAARQGAVALVDG